VTISKILDETGALCSALPRDLRAEMEQKLMEFFGENIRMHTHAKCLIAMGKPCEAILAAVRENGIDLIVMSTRGLTGLKHVLLGSTAEGVVRQANCSVIVIRE
jgi:universal stress protein A